MLIPQSPLGLHYLDRSTACCVGLTLVVGFYPTRFLVGLIGCLSAGQCLLLDTVLALHRRTNAHSVVVVVGAPLFRIVVQCALVVIHQHWVNEEVVVV